MYPTLLEIGVFRFHSYTVCLSIAFVLGVILAVRENYRLEKPYPITTIGGLWAFFFSLTAARAWFILQQNDAPWAHLHEALMFWQGGYAFFGGLLGGLLGSMIYLKLLRQPILPIGDIAAPFVALSLAIARIGCLLNGCCWGPPTKVAWGVCYAEGTKGAYRQQLREKLIEKGAEFSLPAHPTPLYATLGLFAIFFFMRFLYKRGVHRSRPGLLMFLFPILYGILRFMLEFVRADNPTSVLGLLTVAQAASTLFVLCCLVALYFIRAFWWHAETEEAPAAAIQEAATDAPIED
jgi:phosphatidylglycerol---prolipoprotein diacylglyceryl transferase